MPLKISYNIFSAGVATVDIPNSELRPYFLPDKVAVVPLELRMTVRQIEKRFLRSDLVSERTVNARLAIALYPEIAGWVDVKTVSAKYAWIESRVATSKVVRIGDGGAGAGSMEIRVAGGSSSKKEGAERLRNVQYHCNAWFSGNQGICRDQVYYREVVPVDKSLTEDDQLASRTVDVGRAESRDWWITATVDKWLIAGEQNDVQKRIPLYWNRVVTFSIPDSSTQYVIEGQRITKQRISLAVASSEEGFMRHLGDSQPPYKKVNYQVLSPKF